MTSFVALEEALARWPEPPPRELTRTAPRLAAALAQAVEGSCGPADLATLVRDALRHWQEREGRESLPALLRVPAVAPWPTVVEWGRSGVVASATSGGEHLHVTAVRPWRPAWSGGAALDAFAARREDRQPAQEEIPADPVWYEATRLRSHRSLGQREAVRTLLTSAPDATVLVLLPTGSGKSLVGLLQPLVAGPGAVTVVVVPTTGLALDQERNLRDVLRRRSQPDAEHAFAFHAGLSETDRAEFLRRVREGRQRVVFTSPESLFGALRDAVGDAAAHGRLGQFVVDEAHVVTNWGAYFRPRFRALGALRRELAAAAAEGGHNFRTVLMTATATEQEVATLRRLFADEDRPLVVAGAVALRPEIAFAAVACADRDERLERVREALLHLPRPLFLYATTREDVALLVREARALGCERVVTMTGESDDRERRAALLALAGSGERPPTADVGIGTAAFGLGIDVTDVRCVVHACLPESIDRYYQEVGRAGRDGRSAQGLLLWTADDERVARGIGEDRLVGQDLCRRRWEGMLRSAQREDGRTWVSLDALRVGLLFESPANEAWNVRTLASMAQAGLIAFDGVRRREDGGDEVAIRWLRDDLKGQSAWDDYEGMRESSRRSSAESLGRVLAFARGGGICDALHDHYSVDGERASALDLTAELVAHQVCGGCADCAPLGIESTPAVPVAHARGERDATWPPGLAAFAALADDSGLAFALQPAEPAWGRVYAALIEVLASAGVRQLVCDDEVAQQRDVVRALTRAVTAHGSEAPFVTRIGRHAEDELSWLPPAPALLLLAPEAIRHDLGTVLDGLPRPVLAVLPAIQPSGLRSDMTLAQLHPGAPTAADALGRLRAAV